MRFFALALALVPGLLATVAQGAPSGCKPRGGSNTGGWSNEGRGNGGHGNGGRGNGGHGNGNGGRGNGGHGNGNGGNGNGNGGGGNGGRGDNGGSGRQCHTARNRRCWDNTSKFDINTDYETVTPNTGVTRYYNLDVTEEDNWLGPDGQTKTLAMLINGEGLGPTLTADWGDYLQITVNNKLKTNGTSMHWHGMRQLNSNLMDGVNGVTECPIAPGSSRTYRFRATQYGTTWYHSHFTAQYGNGVIGTMVINGPASASYDVDLGTFPIGDYYYDTADNLVQYTERNAPPPSDNVLFNGTNIHPTTGAGAYAEVMLTPNATHRLRIVNPSVENHFVLSMAGHTFTIIANDLVPVNPVNVSSLFIGVGQRYDILITADQPVDNYWFNATFVASGVCGTSVNPYPAAIFRYSGADKSALPTDPGTVIDAPTTCSDPTGLVPVVSRTVPVSSFANNAKQQLNVTLDTANQIFNWRVNGTKLAIDWDKPVDQYVMERNTSYPAQANVVTVHERDQWVFWLIENVGTPFTLPHPIHLHGHDFVVVGTGASPFSSADIAGLATTGNMRRDVAMLPQDGWLLIAYKTDNPGTWLMHCHIAWHVSGGLGLNFLERPNDISFPQSDVAQFQQQCSVWDAYNHPDSQVDSGLRMRSIDM